MFHGHDHMGYSFNSVTSSQTNLIAFDGTFLLNGPSGQESQ